MRRLATIALAFSIALGLGAMSGSADDAHHPEKQAKTKSTAKKPAKKQTTQSAPKQQPKN